MDQSLTQTRRATAGALAEKRLQLLAGPTHSSETGEWKEEKTTEKTSA